MQCPVCKTTNLIMSERQGIEIDYCPQCRGVWLDRGELDKIIERSAGAPAAAPQSQAYQQTYQQPQTHQQSQTYQQDRSSYGQGQGHQGGYHQGGYYKKKREGFLSDLFDFD